MANFNSFLEMFSAHRDHTEAVITVKKLSRGAVCTVSLCDSEGRMIAALTQSVPNRAYALSQILDLCAATDCEV